MKGSSGYGSSGSTAATRGVRVQAKVVRRGDSFRVVGGGDGKLLRGSRGRPVDGGGHWNEAKALRQCAHINANLHRAKMAGDNVEDSE